MNERDRTRAKIIGVLVRDARLHAGRSATETAGPLGAAAELIEAIERGEAVPTLSQLEALAMFLDVPLDHFWGTQTLGNYPETDLSAFVSGRDAAIGAAIRAAREGQGSSLDDLAGRTELPVERLAAAERGENPLNLFELEQVAGALGRSLNAFHDDANELIAHHEARQKQQNRFEQMPADMRAFVTEPINQSYLEIAMRLSRMDVSELRAVAENILNITF